MESHVGNRKRPNQPLRMDYSEVYFRNGRLQQQLARSLNTLDQYKNRQIVDRDFEIRKLRRKLMELQSLTRSRLLPCRTTSDNRLIRPTSSFSNVVKVNVRLPSETGDKEESDSNSDLSSSDDDDSCRSEKGEKKSKTVSKLETQKAKNVPKSVGLVRPVTCLPAAGPTSRRYLSKPARAKSAHPRSMTTETSTVVQLNGGESDSPEKGKNVVGSRRRAVSAAMSRRQLKERCHQEDMKSTYADILRARLEICRLENERLQMRVQQFVKSMDGWVRSNKKTILDYC